MEEKEIKKKGKGKTITIVILILIIIGLVSYIAYDKGAFDSFLNKNDTKEEDNKKEEETNKKEELDINSTEVKKLVDKYTLGGTLTLNDIYFIHSTEKNISNLSNDEFALMASYLNSFPNAKEDTRNDTSLYLVITKDEYNEAFKNTFGPDVEVKSATKASKAYCGSYIYNATNDNYEALQACGGVWPMGSYLVSASKDNNNIYIYEKAYSIDPGEDEVYIYSMNKEDNKIKVSSYEDSYVKENYNDYLDTYKFTLKKASDNNYYFYSVENLNDAKEYK